jgi:uncharacterized protein YigE (DUF2233 family)
MQYPVQSLLALVAFAVPACRGADSSAPQQQPSTAATKAMQVPSAAASAPGATVERPTAAQSIRPEIISVRGETYELYAFDISLKEFRIAAVDLGTTKSLRSALERKGSVLAINAGYFDKNNNPEGLVVSEGKSLSEYKSSLGGGVLTISGQFAQLHDSTGFNPTPQLDFAIQCKPRLVVDGKTNIKTDDKKVAARTAICIKKGGTSLEVFVTQDKTKGPSSGPSLATLADILVARDCEQGINLDGGPSSGVFWQEKGTVKGFAPQANIRQALVIQSP